MGLRMTIKIMVGDALSKLAELQDEKVHCVVTSPPYWGLRSYKGDPGMIGLEPTFDEHLDNLVAVFRDENGGDKLVHGSGGISQPRAE